MNTPFEAVSIVYTLSVVALVWLIILGMLNKGGIVTKLKFLNPMENFILNYTGLILMLIGAIGVIFTYFYAQIARGESYSHWGWLRMTGMTAFILLFVFGVSVEKYLMEIKDILKDYVGK